MTTQPPNLLMPFEQYPWPMKYDHMKPFAHQKETTKFLLLNRRAYVFSDLGTGKTLCPLWAADFLMLNRKIKRVLIISPLSTLQSVWGSEIFAALRHRTYVIAHGQRDYRISAIHSKADFVIMNHDGVVVMEEEIIKAKFDVIVVDELTAFKKHTNERSKSMVRISKKAKAVWGMTGAPTPNGPIEAFGQARVVTPDNPHLPKLYGKFEKMVVEPLTAFISTPKPEAVALVGKILSPSIRFVRDQCIDIPDCMYHDEIVPLSVGQKVAYDKMKDELRIEYENGEINAANAAVKMMKLMQIAAGSVKDDEGQVMYLDSSPRDDKLWEIFEETGKSKLVVFSAFRASIDHLVKFFQKKGVKVAYIHGDVPGATRATHIRNFQEGDLQVLVLQPQSTSHGITLTAANYLVWYSLVPSGEVYLQANGRITRAGQDKKQYIIHLIGTQVEKRVKQILETKGKFSSSILTMFAEL